MHSYGLTRIPPPQPYTNSFGQYSLYPKRYPHSQRHHSLEKALQNKRLNLQDNLDRIQAQFESKRQCLYRGAPSLRNLPQAGYNAHRMRLTDLDIDYKYLPSPFVKLNSPSRVINRDINGLRLSRNIQSIEHIPGRIPNNVFDQSLKRRQVLSNTGSDYYWNDIRY